MTKEWSGRGNEGRKESEGDEKTIIKEKGNWQNMYI